MTQKSSVEIHLMKELFSFSCRQEMLLNLSRSSKAPPTRCITHRKTESYFLCGLSHLLSNVAKTTFLAVIDDLTKGLSVLRFEMLVCVLVGC